ncbi:MAG: DUF1320 domain-containing protein [Deltaproteobacteria bacterium]|jgi:phage gp36-like protein|nr:DUF1320 domain-containing protein [Deltaproteobacteria bacterium]
MAAYATRIDMAERYGESEMKGLEAGKIATTVAAALADASAEADSYLAARYVLPLPDGKAYPSLRWAVCDMARYRLWEAKPKDEEDTVAVRYRRAVSWLQEVAAGDAALLDAGGEEPPAAGRGCSAVVLSGRRKVFTNRVLRGMDYGRD